MSDQSPVAVARRIMPEGPEPLRWQLASWLSTSPRFGTFIETYGAKVSRKLRQSQMDEDKRDVLAELETAYRLLANPDFGVEYEPSAGGGVDFRVNTRQGDFIVEAKRIRESIAMTTYGNSLERIVTAVREINSALGISLECRSLDVGPEYAKELEQAIDSIVTDCTSFVYRCKTELRVGQTRSISVKGFPQLRLRVTHVPEKSPETPTANFGGIWPILHTQREAFKFTDLLLGCLRQFVKDLPNVLIVHSQSTTHHAEELPMAACEILQHAAEGNESFFRHKGFAGIADYRERWTLLSAAVVVTGQIKCPDVRSRNLVWINPAAKVRVDECVLAYFIEM